MSNNYSKEFIRKIINTEDKFLRVSRSLGYRVAVQTHREIGKLHTFYPGQRTEYDHTKYALFLFPNAHWLVPLLFFIGIAVDHFSTAIRGVIVSTAPSSKDTIRLVRNSILPPAMWLPDSLQDIANDWDIFGLEETSAVDNGADLVSHMTSLVFHLLGTLIFRMPVARGDLKGTVERTLYSLETQFIAMYPGYVPSNIVLYSDKYKRLRLRAMKSAKLTVAEFLDRLCRDIVKYNHMPHPTLGKPRIQIWRENQDFSPPILPTGSVQLRTIFALTYESKLTREGVTVDKRKYNSPELNLVYRTNTAKVHVKVDPNDIRSVLVFVPTYDDPFEAHLTTHFLPFPVSMELFQLALKRAKDPLGITEDADVPVDFVLDEVRNLQTGKPEPTQGVTTMTDAKAAVHAATTRPVPEKRPRSEGTPSIDDLLSGTDIDGET